MHKKTGHTHTRPHLFSQDEAGHVGVEAQAHTLHRCQGAREHQPRWELAGSRGAVSHSGGVVAEEDEQIPQQQHRLGCRQLAQRAQQRACGQGKRGGEASAGAGKGAGQLMEGTYGAWHRHLGQRPRRQGSGMKRLMGMMGPQL